MSDRILKGRWYPEPSQLPPPQRNPTQRYCTFPGRSALHNMELAPQAERLRLLLDVSATLATHRDLHRLLQEISTALQRLIKHDYSSLSLYDPNLRQFRLYALDFPEGSGLIKEQVIFSAEGSPHVQVMRSSKPLLVNRLTTQQFPADITRWLLSEGIRSACWLPLQRGDRFIGVLNVASLQENAFDRDAMELLGHVAVQIVVAVENALDFQEITALKDLLNEEKDYLQDEIRTEFAYDEIVGESSAWKKVLQQVETVAPTDANVLILGETGTGKELVARAIHERSRRRDRTFVKLSCAAVPTGLLESELFGHEKGAFTGAIARRIGRFELAHRGTLFLDEVGDIALELQPKILRVLQEQEFERLGSTETRKVDVRIISATNRNLPGMVANRDFREDLYYRLRVFPISLPPLRERRGDIPLLVHYFVAKYGRQMRKRIDEIPVELMEAFSRWEWPGNVRELANFIERAVILTRGPLLEAPVDELQQSAPESSPLEHLTLEAAEKQHILRALRECHGVIGGPKGAAARLGLNRSTLNSRMRKFGIKRNDIWRNATTLS
jgi:formate hydrogenlyase transcriptional activator